MCDFLSDLRGQVAMGFGLAISALAITLAMAINTASAVNQRQYLQSVADETALALAVEINVLLQNNVDLNSVALARVNALLEDRGDDLLESHEVSASTLRVEPAPVPAPPGGVPDDAVEVMIATYPPQSPAMSALNEAPKLIRVSSRALRLGSSNLCVIALNETQPNTFLARDSARLSAPDCDIVSNSTDPDGLNVADAARLHGSEIHSAGGASGQPSAFTPDPITDSLSLPDPLINIPEPDTSTCIPVPGLGSSGSVTTLYPGVYCSGLSINGHREVLLQSGVYSFLGDVEVDTNGTLRSNGATLHFAGGDATFHARAGSTIRMTAPETGATAGILLFESRANTVGNMHKIETDDARYMVGTIYIPNGIFRVNTNAAVSDQSEYTAIVTRGLQLHGGANLYLNTNYDMTSVPTPEGVGPIDEGVRLVR